MNDPVPTAASSALDELLDVSPQVDAAVILRRDGGKLVASAPATSDRMADQLAATCVRIVDAADTARRELGREPVVQVEVSSADGHVFVVCDANWIVAAVTDADPTVGLVFYDLKTALRTVREAGPSSNGTSPKARPVTVVATGDDEPATSSGDDDSATEAPRPAKWRRRNGK